MNFIRNFRIGTRLTLGFGFLLVTLVGMSLLSLNRMSEIQGRLDDIANVSNEQVRQSNVMLVAINRSTAAGTELVLAATPAERDAALAKLAQERKRYDEAEAMLVKSLAKGTVKERDILATIQKQKDAARPQMNELVNAVKARQVRRCAQAAGRAGRPRPDAVAQADRRHGRLPGQGYGRGSQGRRRQLCDDTQLHDRPQPL